MKKLCLVAAICSAVLVTPALAQLDHERGDSEFPPRLAAFKTEKCTVKKPAKGRTNPYERRVNYVTGPKGPEAMTVMSKSMDCRPRSDYWHTWSLLGLRNATGKTIVPEGYRNMYAISPTAAIVQRLDKGWAIHEGGKERPLPFQPASVHPTDARGPCTEILSNPDGTQGVMVYGVTQNGLRDVAYFHGSSEPAIFRGVPQNQPARRIGDRVVINYGDTARVYDLAGVPVSGTFQYIGFWQAKLPWGRTDTCRTGRPQLLAQGPSLDRDPAKAEYGSVWFPLTPSGEFTPLPEGAIGIWPTAVPYHSNPTASLPDGNWDWLSDQWAIVYPDAEGWSWSLYFGDLRDVLAKANNKDPRYRSVSRDPKDGLISAIDTRTGKWVVPTEGGAGRLGTPASDGATARANYRAAWDAQTQARKAAVEREIAERKAKERADYIAFRDQKIREGKLCQYLAPMNHTLAEITVYAQHCAGGFSGDDLMKAKQMGLSPDLVAKVEEGWRQVARNEAAALARREYELANPVPRPYYPGAFSDAIRNAGDMAVDNIKKSSDSWFDARRKAYREEWQRKQRAY